MARRRFFVDEVRKGRAELRDEEARHLTRVLRVEPGQRYEISDNRRAWLAEIETARKDLVVFRALDELPPDAPEVSLHLLSALIKFERFELLVEKATELGAASITPVVAGRSEPGLDRAAVKRVERWRRIALEASQQCRRTRLPEIEAPVQFGVAAARAAGVRLFLDEDHEGAELPGSIPPFGPSQWDIALLIGPEGGWTEAERAAASSAGWTAVSLGPRILRAETAAIAALAIVGAASRKLS